MGLYFMLYPCHSEDMGFRRREKTKNQARARLFLPVSYPLRLQIECIVLQLLFSVFETTTSTALSIIETIL